MNKFQPTSKESIVGYAILLETKEDLGKEGLWFSAMKRNSIAMKQFYIIMKGIL